MVWESCVIDIGVHTPLVDAMFALGECPDSKDIFGVLSYPSPTGRRSGVAQSP